MISKINIPFYHSLSWKTYYFCRFQINNELNHFWRLYKNYPHLIVLIPCFPSVPPRWTVEPTDKQFAQGSDAKVDCKADGFPQPNIIWRKAAGKLSFSNISDLVFSLLYMVTQNPFKFSILLLYDHYCYCYVSAGNKPENYRDLDTAVHSNVKVIDGALVLKNVQKASEGYYLCKATNGIGRGLSAVIYISIQGIL